MTKLPIVAALLLLLVAPSAGQDSDGDHRAVLLRCAKSFPYLTDPRVKRLGVEVYCHCFADKAIAQPGGGAVAACSQIADYPVPRESPLTPSLLPPDLGSASAEQARPQGCTASGDVCDDGTIYAGITADRKRAIYVMPVDLILRFQNGWGPEGHEPVGELCVEPYTMRSCSAGRENTTKLAGQPTQRQDPFTPALMCDEMKAHGHDDWYLPAKNELEIVRRHLGPQPNNGFKDAYYWSSSEMSSNNVWSNYFGGVDDTAYYKRTAFQARCIRSQ